MKAAIGKEQALEIRRWLEKQRVPKSTIDLLLSSQHASNTHKAYRMKKQIVTPDGWAVNFGANWARKLENGSGEAAEAGAGEKPAAESRPAAPKESAGENDESRDIKVRGEDFLSRTFMGLAEKLRRLQIEDVDKPAMQKIAFEVDKDHLAILKRTAQEKGTTVGNLIRVAIRDFIEKN